MSSLRNRLQRQSAAIWRHFMHDSLYRNSIFMMGSMLFQAAFTFAFLTLAARLYSTNDVGVATSAISAITLLANLSILGFNNAVIRFHGSIKKFDAYVNAVMAIVAVASVLSSVIFLAGSRWFSPKLAFFAHRPVLVAGFVLLTVLTTINLFTDSVFVAKRIAVYIFIENIGMGIVKAGTPALFSGTRYYGILAAFTFGVAVALAVTFAAFRTFRYHFRERPDFGLINGTRGYAFGNYISGIASSCAPLIVPLIVINRLGAKSAAYFYVALSLANLLYVIPSSINRSLFAEGSASEENIHRHIIKSLKLTSILLLLAIAGLLLFGKLILHVFGKGYAQASFDVLMLLAVSGVFVAVVSVVGTILNIKRRVLPMTVMNVISLACVLGMSALFAHGGLVALGRGWLIGQALGAASAVGFYMIFARSRPVEKGAKA